jgi:hypothetical protein
MLLPKNQCSTSLFTSGYKRLAEGGLEVFLMGDFDWLLLPLMLAAVCLHQSSVLH